MIGLVLPVESRMVKASHVGSQFFIDHQARFGMRIPLDAPQKEAVAHVILDGTFKSEFRMTRMGGDIGGFVEVPTDRVDIVAKSFVRGVPFEAPAGSIIVTEAGSFLVAHPYDDGGDTVFADLAGGLQQPHPQQVCTVIKSYSLVGWKGRDQVFDIRVAHE